MDVSKSLLIGAARWLDELRSRTEADARLVLQSSPQRRDLTPTQYELSLEWLRAVGLHPPDSGVLRVRNPGALVLSAYLEAMPPLWLSDADSLVRTVDDLPIDIAELGHELAISPGEAIAEVHRVWRKFDDSARRELGAAGEHALVDWLAESCSEEILHVSEFDDSAGYDIALLRDHRLVAMIEVKATRLLDSAVVYLSRNELETMRLNPEWCIQIVHLDALNGIRALSWIDRDSLSAGAPNDGALAVWQVMKMTLGAHELRPGPAPEVERFIRHSRR